MKQFITLFGLVCLACVALAQENSTDTAPLAASEDVKPALSEAQAANQKVDNAELDRADVKEKANDAVDSVADKIDDAKQAGSDAIDSAKSKASDAADSVKSGADSAAQKTKEGADAAKDKIQNSASGLVSFTAFASAIVMLALTRL